MKTLANWLIAPPQCSEGFNYFSFAQEVIFPRNNYHGREECACPFKAFWMTPLLTITITNSFQVSNTFPVWYAWCIESLTTFWGTKLPDCYTSIFLVNMLLSPCSDTQGNDVLDLLVYHGLTRAQMCRWWKRVIFLYRGWNSSSFLPERYIWIFCDIFLLDDPSHSSESNFDHGGEECHAAQLWYLVI